MKKTTIVWIFFLGIVNLYAQEIQTYTESFDSIFRNISRSDATTGILYDRVIPFANLKNFNSNSSQSVDTGSMKHFMQSYLELYDATFQATSVLPFSIDSLESYINANSSFVNIGLLHYKFNTMDSAAVQQKTYFGADNILYENSSLNLSLYQEKTAFIASPLQEFVNLGTTTFRFSDLFYFDNTDNPIVQLSVDFDDGNGMRLITDSLITVTYNYYGIKTLRFDVLLHNGEVLTAYCRINCTPTSSMYANTPSNHPYVNNYYNIQAKIAPANPYTGGVFSKAKANVRIYYAHSDKKLRKPVLIADGFDPENVRTFESHENSGGKSIWEMLYYNNDRHHVGKTLLQKGYDLVVIDFPEGGTYIERNAMACIEVINVINRMLRESGSNEEIVVVGPSMGGQITRYALAYMEQNPQANTNYGNHNCRLWISFDSPHQGANISMGAQAFVYYFRGIKAAKDLWNNTLNCVAAQQMLIYHKNSNARSVNNRYYTNLNNLGYPSNLRKIAISNGSLNNSPHNGSSGAEAFHLILPYVIYNLDAKIRMYPSSGQTVKVFDVWHVVLGIPINNTWTETRHSYNFCSIDAAPGCVYPTFKIIGDLTSNLGIANVRIPNHCFMPITSVLDISGNMNYCSNVSGRDLVAERKIPFQSYWGPTNQNMEHISFNTSLVNWVLNEIETYIQGDRNITICDKGIYNLHLPSTASSNTEIRWSCSDNVRIVSGQGTAQLTVQAISEGEGWIRVSAGNLKHSKILKDFKITVNPRGNLLIAPSSVSQNTTWTKDYELPHNLTIKNNATLTVSSTLFCAPGCNIIVEPGSKLIVKGGKLTNSCDGDLWQGVIIKGNPQDRQQSFSSQGCVELMDATIENANIGILVGSKNLSENHGGGILQATQTKFINCVTSVEFKGYVRTINHVEGSNRSFLKECEFVWDEGFVAPVLLSSYHHVKLTDVGIISFKGCSFYNRKFSNSIVTQGIYGYNANVSVSAITALSVSEEVILKRSYFKNFTYGIYYAKNDGFRKISLSNFPVFLNRYLFVSHSDFISNMIGIFNTNANNSIIKHNTFEVCPFAIIPIADSDYVGEEETKPLAEKNGSQNLSSPVPIFNNPFGAGINLNASTGYTIHENIFTRTNSTNINSVGIHVKNSGGSPNVIHNNQFHLLHVGILSNGNNKADYTDIGLQVRCNTFSKDCQYAIAVNTPNGIAQIQGSQEKAAGNVFSQTNRPDAGDVYINDAIPTYYYYNSTIAEEKPTQVTLPYVNLFSTKKPGKCDLSNNDVDIVTIVKSVTTGVAKYNDLYAEYLNIMDFYFNLGLLSETDKDNSDYILKNREKLSLITSLSGVAQELESASRQLINLYLTDTTQKTDPINLVTDVLKQLPHTESVYNLADLYADINRFDLAREQLHRLYERKLSEREKKELNVFEKWYDFIENYTKGDSKNTLTKNDVAILKEIAETGTKAGERAKSMFYHYSGCSYNYHVEAEFPDFIIPKSTLSICHSQDVPIESNNHVTVFPNPAATHTTFAYELQSEIKNSILQIFDDKGILVLSVELTENTGSYIWDTRHVSSGIYVYVISSHEKKLHQGKVIVRK